MSMVQTPSFLRNVLLVDAAGAAAMGLLLLAAANALDSLLGLPAPLLRAAGTVLLPFALFVGVLARQSSPWRNGVWTVVSVNAIWVVESVWLLFTHRVELTGSGVAFVIAQATFVALMAQLEFLAVRRSTSVLA